VKQQQEILKVAIKENSLLARVAAFNLKTSAVAMVIGSTIHLWGVNRENFLQDKQWVLHELRHVLQYQKMGVAKFLWRYIKISMKKGYYNHPYEVSARLHEADEDLLERVEFV
jgi:hypothetical protein